MLSNDVNIKINSCWTGLVSEKGRKCPAGSQFRTRLNNILKVKRVLAQA